MAGVLTAPDRVFRPFPVGAPLVGAHKGGANALTQGRRCKQTAMKLTGGHRDRPYPMIVIGLRLTAKLLQHVVVKCVWLGQVADAGRTV